jgi:hypothetical protein
MPPPGRRRITGVLPDGDPQRNQDLLDFDSLLPETTIVEGLGRAFERRKWKEGLHGCGCPDN